jgi:hypothetical protein
MGTGVGEAMLIGAATGGGMSAVTGGDPLKGAILGAATAGIGDKIAGLQAASEGANVAQGAQAAQAAGEGVKAATTQQLALQNAGMNPAQIAAHTKGSTLGSSLASTPPTASNPMFPKIAEMSKSAYFAPGLGAMGATVGGALTPQTDMPGGSRYSGPLSRFRYDPNKYKRQMATGGLADTAPAQRMMQGGQLGSYSDGGQLLSGPGNGMSDDIPANIGGKQPARLADGEFVVPADVVSGIGNGSTGAGADELYRMLDRVRLARTGSDKQGREISPMKYLPT